MKKKYILYLFLIIIQIITCWKCGADQLKIKPKGIDLAKYSNKRKLASSYSAIRIMADYSNLRATSGISDSTIEQVKQLIDETCNEFSKILEVVPIGTQLSIGEDDIKYSCDVDNIGSGYQSYFLFSDLVIFPTFDSTLATNVLAAAGMCMYLTESIRPIYGVLLINPNLSFSKRNTNLYMKNLFFHELTHVLVFSPELFSSLGMMTTRIFDGSFVSFINSPKVLTTARQHFNCTSLNGVPLENQGGSGSAGSHWEARYLLGDYMISSDYFDNVISDITLALFEDSGIYKVNYYSGGLFKFGKNMGCEFFDNKCLEGGNTAFKNEFCTVKSEYICSRTKISRGQCILNEYSSTIPKRYRYFSDSDVGGFEPANYCPVSNTVSQSSDYYHASCRVGSTSLSSDFGEVIGNSSFCFLSSLLPSNSQLSSSSRAICYQVECDSENKQIIVNIGNNKVYCPTDGGTIDNPSGFKGSINCPEYYEICGQETENEGEICNDMYDCFDKKAETNINTISFFPEEDYVFVKRSEGNMIFIFNFNLILLFLILYI
jgi:hypothetical protein